MESLNKSLYAFYEERRITVGLLLCQCRGTAKSKMSRQLHLCSKHSSFRNNPGFRGGQKHLQHFAVLLKRGSMQCPSPFKLFYYWQTSPEAQQRELPFPFPSGNSQAALTTPLPTPSHQTNLQNSIFVHQDASVHHPWPCSCVAFLIKVVSSQSSPVIYVSSLELELH